MIGVAKASELSKDPHQGSSVASRFSSTPHLKRFGVLEIRAMMSLAH